MIQRKKYQIGPRKVCCRVLQRPDFSGKCVRLIDAGTDLNQFFAAFDMARMKIEFKAFGGAHIGNFGAASIQFQKHGSFKRKAEIGFSRSIKNRNR